MKWFPHIALAQLSVWTVLFLNPVVAWAAEEKGGHGLEMEVNGYHITLSSENDAVAIIVPVTLVAITSWIAGKFNKTSLLENFTRLGYAVIALDVAGHMAHNLPGWIAVYRLPDCQEQSCRQ